MPPICPEISYDTVYATITGCIECTVLQLINFYDMLITYQYTSVYTND